MDITKLESLPNEILCQILSNVSSLRDIRRIQRLSKRVNAVLNDCIRTISVHISDSPPTLSEVLSFPRLERIIFSNPLPQLTTSYVPVPYSSALSQLADMGHLKQGRFIVNNAREPITTFIKALTLFIANYCSGAQRSFNNVDFEFCLANHNCLQIRDNHLTIKLSQPMLRKAHQQRLFDSLLATFNECTPLTSMTFENSLDELLIPILQKYPLHRFNFIHLIPNAEEQNKKEGEIIVTLATFIPEIVEISQREEDLHSDAMFYQSGVIDQLRALPGIYPHVTVFEVSVSANDNVNLILEKFPNVKRLKIRINLTRDIILQYALEREMISQEEVEEEGDDFNIFTHLSVDDYIEYIDDGFMQGAYALPDLADNPQIEQVIIEYWPLNVEDAVTATEFEDIEDIVGSATYEIPNFEKAIRSLSSKFKVQSAWLV